MSRFYGTVRGAKGEASRLGHTSLHTVAASYQGAVDVYLYADGAVDCARISLKPWGGNGSSRVLYDGPVSGEEREVSLQALRAAVTTA